jgi:hypothetical protein
VPDLESRKVLSEVSAQFTPQGAGATSAPVLISVRINSRLSFSKAESAGLASIPLPEQPLDAV